MPFADIVFWLLGILRLSSLTALKVCRQTCEVKQRTLVWSAVVPSKEYDHYISSLSFMRQHLHRSKNGCLCEVIILIGFRVQLGTLGGSICQYKASTLHPKAYSKPKTVLLKRPIIIPELDTRSPELAQHLCPD